MASVNKKSFEYDPHTLPNGENFKFHLVVSEWNKTITYSLSSAAIKTLLKAGVKEENILIWSVPGSFELIYGSKKHRKIIQMRSLRLAVLFRVKQNTLNIFVKQLHME